MKTKNVERIIAPREPHFVGDGFRVHNFIPSAPGVDMLRMDPFIMLDYGSTYAFGPSEKPKGVGVHPHRGFETVTIAYKGKVQHNDSSGGGGIIEEGGVQWMTAGSGILHKEYHEKEWSKNGGDFQMVQLWVNLPAKDKMTKPKYQALGADQIPNYTFEGGSVEVIAGEFNGIKGAANTFSPMQVYNVNLGREASIELNLPEKYSTALLVVKGRVRINNTEVAPQDYFTLFGNEGTEIQFEGLEDSKLLVLSGEPLKEPIAAHGPFVMNTRQQLMEAFNDFNNGGFGYLEDDDEN